MQKTVSCLLITSFFKGILFGKTIFFFRKIIQKFRKDKEYKPVEWKYRPKIEKVEKNDDQTQTYDNLNRQPVTYDNICQGFKQNAEYAELESLMYAKFPNVEINNNNNINKPNQPPPPKPIENKKENQIVKTKPPIDHKVKNRLSAIYSRVNLKNKKVEMTYDNLNPNDTFYDTNV
jgi:hypothetical protein